MKGQDNDINRLFDGRYNLLKRLSDEGATADVWLAIDTLTQEKSLNDDGDCEDTVIDEDSGTRVAIKIYRPKNALDVEGESLFIKEFKTAYNCQHENLLAPTGYGIANDIPYLVMPYCSNGSAGNLVGKISDEKEVWKFLQQTASGLAYLHSCKPPIIHQDIKPGNILIDDNGNYRITDFGISVKRDYNRKSYLDDKDSGTTDFMPPERCGDGSTSLPVPESDIWSLGATAFELITGRSPFGEQGGSAQKRVTPVPKIDAPVSKELKRVVYSCLEYNIADRPTASALADMAKRKRFRRIKPLTFLMALLSAALIIGGVAHFLERTNTPTPKQIRTALCHTWVYDVEEEGVFEINRFTESGKVFSSYYSRAVVEFSEAPVAAYSIERGNHFITISTVHDREGQLRTMKIDWSIDTINPLQGTFTTVLLNDTIELNSQFTYSRLLSKFDVLVNQHLEPAYAEFLPKEREAYKTSENGKINGYTIKDPIIQRFISHDPNIATVNRKTGQIVGIQKGTTYIDVVTTEGTAVVEVNVIDSQETSN